MSANSTHDLPYFQQLQQQFAGHIRNPENTVYSPEREAPIESRRLLAYQSLFFNNIESFMSKMFPICLDILGSDRWLQILREYMIKHNSTTPLFHELGEEFLSFLQDEFEPLESDPPFLLELAHYEWVELALSVSTEAGFTPDSTVDQGESHVINLDLKYQLSPLAWPLAYEWPVQLLSKDFQPTEKPNDVTTLLVYRHLSEQTEQTEQGGGSDEMIDFMEITPLLYQWLTILDASESARSAFEYVADAYQLTPELLEDVIQDLLDLNILQPAV